MTDISEKTWKYLHGPDDVAHLSFPTAGVPRSFSVIRYSAIEAGDVDLDRDGIAVIDNDTMSVVLDGHLRGRGLDQLSFMSDIRKMDWTAFSAFASAHPRYRGRQADFGRDTPDRGVLVNQIQRGVMHAPAGEHDLRSPAMVAANADPACPYAFPEASRSRMVSEILQHECHRDADGQWRLSWSLAADAGELPALPEGDRDETEADWLSHYTETPELRHQAIGEMLEPYFSGAVGTWPASDAGRYAFRPDGLSETGVLCLDTIDGADMGFRTRGDFGQFLDALPDTAIRDIWKLARVIDHEMSEPVVAARLADRIAEFRTDFVDAIAPDQGLQATPA